MRGLSFLTEQLTERAEQGYLRERIAIDYERDGIIGVDGQHYLNFASNDYLGLRQHEGVLQAWVEGLAQYGGGSGASPLVTGYSRAHALLEQTIATQLNREAVLLFNSGFAANQALCQALLSEGGTVVCDKLMHASFIDGAMHSKAQLKRFAHNDLEHLTSILQKIDTETRLIASEGVFSMDGDCGRLTELSKLAKQSESAFLLDDAHGFGVLGDNGLGSVEALSLSQEDCPIVMATFGKAIGTSGAFIAGSQTLIDYLVNFARHYIYSTALPPAQAVATMAAIDVMQNGEQRERLHTNIALFRQLAESEGLILADSISPIQPVIVGSPHAAKAMSEGLKQRGIWVPAIRYPTVPKGTDRLRITLSASHGEQDIQVLVDALVLVRDSNNEKGCK